MNPSSNTLATDKNVEQIFEIAKQVTLRLAVYPSLVVSVARRSYSFDMNGWVIHISVSKNGDRIALERSLYASELNSDMFDADGLIEKLVGAVKAKLENDFDARWQPINIAPEDGRRLLIRGQNYAGEWQRPCIARRIRPPQENFGDYPFWSATEDEHGNCVRVNFNPLQWQPLTPELEKLYADPI